MERTKRKTLGQVLGEVACSTRSDLSDLILVISALITSGWDSEVADLVEEMESFKANISQIAELVASHLIEVDRHFTDMASMATDATSMADRHQPSPSLFDTLSPQVDHLSTLRASVDGRLEGLTTTLLDGLSQTQHLLHHQIQNLEFRHGVASRHLVSRAAFLATVAEAMNLKTRLAVLEGQARQAVSVTPRLQRLQTEHQQLDHTIAQLETVLKEYEAITNNGDKKSSVDIITTLGNRYAQIEADMHAVRADIDRLQKQALPPG